VAEAVREAGMGFGIWCEPEAVGACSDLRARHPDWVHHIDGKAPAADCKLFEVVAEGAFELWTSGSRSTKRRLALLVQKYKF
jgi:hypothetical protein